MYGFLFFLKKKRIFFAFLFGDSKGFSIFAKIFAKQYLLLIVGGILFHIKSLFCP